MAPWECRALFEASDPAAPRPRDDAPRGPGHPRVEGALARPETRPVSAAPIVADARPLDLNRATVAELARLPGVGPGLAQRILEERGRRGRFDSPEALRQVVGLGPKKLAALRDLVTVG